MKRATPVFLLLALTVDADPNGVHVALSGDGMTVSWSTVEPLKGEPQVKYGAVSGELNLQSVEGESIQYLAGAAEQHHTTLRPLEPSTTYFYAIFDEDVNEWTPEFKFTTVSGPDSDTLTFAVFGDLGESEQGHNGGSTMEWLGSVGPEIDLIWHAGDLGYADDSFLHAGCLFEFCYETVFDNFMAEMQSVAKVSELPWMTMPGNHEADCHDPACFAKKEYRDSLSNFTAYNARFKMPSDQSGGNSNMWYSFDAGPVHFVSLDLETGYPGAAESKRYVFKSGGFEGNMSAWLEHDLAAVNRTATPWVLVAGHHPMYQGGTVNKDMQAALEGILHTYEVDAMFTGHVHSYERDYPVFNSQLESTSYEDPTATVHIMIGGAGNDEMDGSQVEPPAAAAAAATPPSSSSSSSSSWVDPSKEIVAADNKNMYAKPSASSSSDWIAVQDKGHFGAGLVKVHNATHLHFSYIRTTEGEVFDEIWIVKNGHV